MGVMRCDRYRCENIMCDRYSIDYGSICGECFDELEASKTMDIGHFMATPKAKQPLGVTINYDAVFPVDR